MRNNTCKQKKKKNNRNSFIVVLKTSGATLLGQYLKETREAGAAAVPEERQVAITGEKEITGNQNAHLHIEGDNLTGSRHVVDQYHQLHPTYTHKLNMKFSKCEKGNSRNVIELSDDVWAYTFPFVRLIAMENFGASALFVEEKA